MKSNYNSENIISLHKKLKEMERELDDFGTDDWDKAFDEKYYFEKCISRSEYIKRWMEEIDYFANSIMLDFQSLHSNILTCKKINEYLASTIREEEIITAYFKDLSNTQIDEIIEEQNNG